MKPKRNKVVGVYIIATIVSALVIGLVWGMVQDIEKIEIGRNICAEALGMEYVFGSGFTDGFSYSHHKTRDGFMCCSFQRWVGEEGEYKEGKRCKEFTQ